MQAFSFQGNIPVRQLMNWVVWTIQGNQILLQVPQSISDILQSCHDYISSSYEIEKPSRKETNY